MAQFPQQERAKWGRRIILLAIAAVAWTFLACYPNPAVFIRSLQRYRRFPIDPGLERRMGWQLPRQPSGIEAFVHTLFVPTPDWRLYRVPWYMPNAIEAGRATHGDCESKFIVLASLLAGKGIPFQVRASLSHIWVDYPGRRPQAGESREFAYLEGERGRLSLRWPAQVDWRATLAIQRRQLWEAMPGARKMLWLLGLTWIFVLTLVFGFPQPKGALESRWRIPIGPYVTRGGLMSAAVLALLAVSLWSDRPPRWSLADLWEALALSAAAGAFVTWLTVLRSQRSAAISDDAKEVMVYSSLGPWQSERRLESAKITHIRADGSAGGLRPWVVSAALRTGERIALVRHRRELDARAAARALGLTLNRPIVVRMDGWESRTDPDEIVRFLRERAARRPKPEVLPRPAGCDLMVEEDAGRWQMHYPAAGRGWVFLLGMALSPVLLSGLLTYAILRRPWIIAFWAGWVIATAFLGLGVYVAFMLKGEIVARLMGIRVEIAEGELRFHTSERKVQRVALDRIESVELGRVAESPTVAIISPDQIIHLRDLCPMEDRAWVRQQVEEAILRAS